MVPKGAVYFFEVGGAGAMTWRVDLRREDEPDTTVGWIYEAEQGVYYRSVYLPSDRRAFPETLDEAQAAFLRRHRSAAFHRGDRVMDEIRDTLEDLGGEPWATLDELAGY